ncbi:coiled-coil domain-containing protein 42 homolog [Pogona vitticeps]
MENDQLTIALDAKKQEIKEKLEGLAQRRKEIFQKDRNSWTQGFACDLYLKECEQKKHRALEKYRREQKNNAAKRQEIVQLKKKIQKLKFRQEELQKKIGKYKRFEEFLQKIFDALPSTEYGYLAYGEDSLVKTLIKRHRTLVTEKERLLRKLSVQQYSLQETLHEFRVLQEEYNTAQYVMLFQHFYESLSKPI